MTDRTCTVDECESVAASLGWCRRHYLRHWRTGSTDFPEPWPDICIVDECGQTTIALGWCSKHYYRMKRRGTLEPRRQGSILNGKKICPACKVDKPLSEFGVNRFLASGVHTYCRVCANARAVEARKLIAPEVLTARMRAWQQANPSYWQVGNSARRARLRGCAREAVVPVVVFDRDGWICRLCLVSIPRVVLYPHPLYATVDHIIPLARGGDHLYSNCAAAHFICNMRKGTRDQT